MIEPIRDGFFGHRQTGFICTGLDQSAQGVLVCGGLDIVFDEGCRER